MRSNAIARLNEYQPSNIARAMSARTISSRSVGSDQRRSIEGTERTNRSPRMCFAVWMEDPARTAGLTVLSLLQASTFADLSSMPRFIPAAPSDVRAKRGDHGPGERHVLARRRQLDRCLRVG